ncbi:Alpha/Beta hydrolase protein [Trametes polyzona]|nr:Alpha/Beta hydrolase protein [Trametes polyzona]
MPTAPVDDKGTVLYYEDTGAPSGSSDYITLVLIHGTCFHSAIYRPLIPFAGERNLRLLLLNLRDYPGSTPLSEEEIDGLRGPSVDVQDRTLRDRGLEIAAFCRWFIETEKIPPVRESVTPEGVRARVGGLSILSWSGGNCTTVAMFAHVDKIPEETRRLFDTHLRSFILYDPSATTIGRPRPAGLTALKSNPTAPVDVQVADLAVAVASYYPVFTFPDRIEPMPDYPTRQPLHLSADAVDPKYIPTTTKMPPEVLRSVTHPPVMAQNQHLLWSLSHAVYRENLRRALYDCRFDFAGGGGGAGEKAWPALPVHVVWCDMSVGDCLWASVVIHALYEEADPERRRRVEFHKLEGANHFVHWEEPERFVEFLASIV